MFIYFFVVFRNVGVDAIVIGSCSWGRFMRNRKLPPLVYLYVWGRLGASVIHLVWVLFFRVDIFGGFGFSSTLFMW